MNAFLFVDSVMAALKRQVEEEAGHVANGVASDWGDYRLRVGRIAGLTAALAITEEVRDSLLGKIG